MNNSKIESRVRTLMELSEEELYDKFWELSVRLVSPLVKVAETHTTPSIERSILMRMGFSSIEAQAFVDKCTTERVINKGAGAIIFNYALSNRVSYVDAFNLLMKLDSWKNI